jgi:murein DD-endopeptidase MepM/ murein hydrolase activator NlpD
MNTLAFLFLLVGTITVPQGKAFELSVPHENGIQSVSAKWQGKAIPLARSGEQWVAVVGTDLLMKAGDYTASVSVVRAKGATTESVRVHVTAVKFPTTQFQVEDKYVDLSAPDLARANRETEELNQIHRTITSEMLWTEPFRAPIDGKIEASNFGHRRVFNGEPRAPHAGADLRAVTGTRVLAANRGRVVLAKDLFFTGNTVIVDHGQGVYSLYAHLSRIDVEPGNMVDRGQLLGLSGATGRVTGPHLHWGVKVQDARVDPFSLIDMKPVSVSATASGPSLNGK